MRINNYRVTFGGEGIDYHDNFKSCTQYIELIQDVFGILKKYAVEEKWYFFEPYVEITWIDDGGLFDFIRPEIIRLLQAKNIETFKFSTPDNGAICDWYCNSEQEREFGYKTYSKSTNIALLFHKYKDHIQKGKGLENQFVRRCHVLANQLALNYKQEGIFLIKRGVLCLLFWFLGHSKAVWIYKNIFRFKY